MDYKLIHKLMALPLNTTERAVTSSIAYHVQSDGNSSFPSYETIHKESGAANKTISKVIRTLSYAGILERKHRGDTLTGKESNEYFFIFEGIRFYQSKKLSKADYAALEAKLKKLRKQVIAEMDQEAKARKSGAPPSNRKPSQMLRADTVKNVTKQNVQNVNNDVRAVAGTKGCSIPSQMSPIPSQMLLRSNNTDTYTTNGHGHQTTTVDTEGQSQKQSAEVKSINTPRKPPEDQTVDEWLSDYGSDYASIRG